MPTTKYQQHTFVLTSWKNAPSSPILCRITVQLLCKGKPVEIQQRNGAHLRHKAMQSEMYNDQSSFVCQCEELFIVIYILYVFSKEAHIIRYHPDILVVGTKISKVHQLLTNAIFDIPSLVSDHKFRPIRTSPRESV